MRKRRGKQPVKPNAAEALKDRIIDLKGAQFSSMNIPIVYRRTFEWHGDSVLFRPINKRAFVVLRPGLENEEMELAGYAQRTLDLDTLPHYAKARPQAEESEEYHLEELKESLISLALTDRYVNVDIPRPTDPLLDGMLRQDLEFLSRELGYNYSMQAGSYRCTFIFPRYSNEQTVRMCMQTIREALDQLDDFQVKLDRLDLKKAGARLKDLAYSISTAEHVMDRHYTEALNVHWDLPGTEPAGHFLIVQACERVFDEVEYIVNCSRDVADLLEAEKRPGFLWEMFVNLWKTSVHSSLGSLREALDTVDHPDAVARCLIILRRHRQFKEERSSKQVEYVSHLTGSVEDRGGYRPLISKEYLEVLHHLFGMNQASTRIEETAAIIATKVLYLRNSGSKTRGRSPA